MRARSFPFAALVVLVLGVVLAGTPTRGGAEESSPKGEWKESGSSWKQSGRELLDALGKSVRGERGLKEEWKEVGKGFEGAGRETADAIGKSASAAAEDAPPEPGPPAAPGDAPVAAPPTAVPPAAPATPAAEATGADR